MLKTYLSIAAAAVMTLTITTGCSTNDYVEPVVPLETYTGVFIDNNVSGLTFSCGAHSGLTDIAGKFTGCYTIDPVSFHLGNLKLGSMTYPKGGVFSPRGLAEAKYPGDTAKQTAMKSNIAATVLSMDVDGDPTNGISITPANIEIFNKTVPVNAEVVDTGVVVVKDTGVVEDITTDVITAVDDVVAADKTGQMVTVTPTEAEAHLTEVEKAIDEGIYNQPDPVVIEPIPTGTGSF